MPATTGLGGKRVSERWGARMLPSEPMRGIRAFSPSPNTLLEADRESEHAQVAARVRRIAACLEDEKDVSVLVYAMGGQRHGTIAALASNPGVELSWSRSLIPAYLGPLRLLMASYAGLLRVVDVSLLEATFLRAFDRSMAALYVVRKEYESDLIHRTREPRQSAKYDFGIKRDSRYLIYMVDADSFESSTGAYEVVSLGTGASPCMRACFDEF
jgi:hypothetical protein